LINKCSLSTNSKIRWGENSHVGIILVEQRQQRNEDEEAREEERSRLYVLPSVLQEIEFCCRKGDY